MSDRIKAEVADALRRMPGGLVSRNPEAEAKLINGLAKDIAKLRKPPGKIKVSPQSPYGRIQHD